MNANELRIGNLVTIDNPIAWPELKGEVLTVDKLDNETDSSFPNSTGGIGLSYKVKNKYPKKLNQFDEFVQPIPLTEEWLLKFGGKNMGGWIGLKFELKVWDNIIEYTFELIDGILTLYCNDLTLKKMGNPFVHQLQNLYWCLRDEELTLTK